MHRERQNYMFHLDNIRLKKNITIKELCDGICDTRQYRKYKSGKNNISDMRILDFCNRLGISTRDFYYTLNDKDEHDFSKLKLLYGKIIENQYKDAHELLEKGFQNSYLNVQNKRLLEYCKIKYMHCLKRNAPQETVYQIQNHINIKQCYEYEIFDFVDILFILLLAEIQVETRKTQAIDILMGILKKPEKLFLSPEKRDLIAPIYTNISIMLGRLNRLNDLLTINLSGINYCIKYSYSKSLTKLYQTRALALKTLGKTSEVDKYIAKSLANSISIETTKQTITLSEQLVKQFNINPEKVLKEYFE